MPSYGRQKNPDLMIETTPTVSALDYSGGKCFAFMGRRFEQHGSSVLGYGFSYDATMAMSSAVGSQSKRISTI